MPIKSSLSLLLTGLLVVLSLCGCGTQIHSVSAEESVYDRVMRTGKIRCGYAVYNPGCLKDPNTKKLSGIGIDALELIAKNLGLKVEWTEEVGWGSMIEGLQTNRYDIMATPIWATSNRAREIDSSKPLYFSPVYAYVKAGNKTFSGGNLILLNSPKYSIASIDGATGEVIAEEDFPNVRRVSLPQLTDFSQLLLTVSSGKADAAFTEPADAMLFMKNNPNSVEKVGDPVRVFSNCWIFRRGQFEFKAMLDTALDQVINSGEMEKIIRKYEPVPNVLFRVSRPYQVPKQSLGATK